jgi:hypothetical protein
MALLYGGAWRLTAKNGGFRPGQWRRATPNQSCSYSSDCANYGRQAVVSMHAYMYIFPSLCCAPPTAPSTLHHNDSSRTPLALLLVVLLRRQRDWAPKNLPAGRPPAHWNHALHDWGGGPQTRAVVPLFLSRHVPAHGEDPRRATHRHRCGQ